MELDLSLLKDETYGLHARYVWEANRNIVHAYLNRKLSLHGQGYTDSLRINQMTWFTFICFSGRFIYSILIKNWLWAPKKRDWLIFQPYHRMKLPNDRGYEDIYTDELIDEIGINKCVIIERSFQKKHYTPEIHKVFHFEFLSIIFRFIRSIISLLKKYDSNAIDNMIRDVKIYVENKIEQEVDIESLFNVKWLFSNYYSYLFMLKWLKPKRVLLVVSTNFAPLILAASTLHIPTIELQHGIIASEQLDYSVPSGMTKKFFPDYLLLFGKYWKEVIDNFPLPPERLVTLGYPYFERMYKKNKNLNKREDQIVVISQGTIGKELSKFAVKLANIKKGIYRIIYKLHPGEWGRAQTIYTELYEAQEMGLLDIVDTDTPSVYTLFFRSRWQIGVYSTALFEGIALGCQLILVDLPGIEHLSSLIKKERVQVVKTPEEIQFRETENFMTLREDLFASDWRSNWRNFEQMDISCRFS